MAFLHFALSCRCRDEACMEQGPVIVLILLLTLPGFYLLMNNRHGVHPEFCCDMGFRMLC